MKLYIFITTPINIPGGSQCYVAAKAKYLENTGWDVIIFSPTVNWKKEQCPIKYLNKYLKYSIAELNLPPYKFPCVLVTNVLNRMSNIVGDKSLYCEKIIESHEDSYSQWGELFAKKITARHYFFTMNEFYRGENLYYEEKMDFYNFKFNRKEIEGGIETIKRLFEGYRDITAEDIHGTLLLDECPIMDYENEKVDKIIKYDWNICYIGRGNKSYVPSILNDVGKFASMYPHKQIQFITVSDIESHSKIINELLHSNINLTITELGLLHPIPLNLYKKIDVVIAGSGSARHSCEAGAIVIVADTETKMSNGILGYETLNSLYKGEDSICTDYVDALKRVLVEKVYLRLKYKFPPKIGVERQTKQHFELFAMSSPTQEYYNEEKILYGSIDIIALIKLYSLFYFTSLYRGLSRLKKYIRIVMCRKSNL